MLGLRYLIPQQDNSEWTLRLPRRCPYTIPVIALGVLSLLVVIATLVLLLISYQSIPDEVPTHFAWNGTPDAFGPKWTLWLLLGLDILIWLSLVIFGHFPRTWSIPVRIHAHNQWHVCKATRILLYVVNLLVVLLFGLIVLASIVNLNITLPAFSVLAGLFLIMPGYWLVVRRG